MVAGFVGTVIGYVSANAQQVVGFLYGSIKGSEQKTDAMAAAFTQTFGATTATAAATQQPKKARHTGSVTRWNTRATRWGHAAQSHTNGTPERKQKASPVE
ncbi:hypothetical protein BZM27_46190 [Paraburkholderia steynii]|uniref:Uncharacterized protein n=1 Tax=Paraburkholderia steynii TaxID=1245441 RepID=A0A4V2NG62_9BURK|nr:hypothetical protein BZM27_46190 [Paraburkholderia steynii]